MADIRRDFQDSAYENRKKITDALLEVLDSWKEVESMKCHCGRRTKFRVADGNARVAAATKLVELGYGKAVSEPAPSERGVEELTDDELDRLVALAEAAESRAGETEVAAAGAG